MFGKERMGFSFFSFSSGAAGATPTKSLKGPETSEYTAADTSTGPVASLLEGGAACAEIVLPIMSATNTASAKTFLVIFYSPREANQINMTK
jgi:hypothetical protein